METLHKIAICCVCLGLGIGLMSGNVLAGLGVCFGMAGIITVISLIIDASEG